MQIIQKSKQFHIKQTRKTWHNYINNKNNADINFFYIFQIKYLRSLYKKMFTEINANSFHSLRRLTFSK